MGSQIVGYDGVDKRIDVIATAIRFGGTVYDLEELELAYAPPYSSAKDPVNMVGFASENILSGTVNAFRWQEFESIDMKNTIILDVREEIERELGYIEGSINIPLDDLRERMVELDKNKKIIVYCAIGLRGYVGARILLQNGFKNVYNFNGGYSTFSTVFCQENGEKCGGNVVTSEADFSERGDIESSEVIETGKIIKLNACGLQCPGPILQVYNSLKEMEDGDVLEVKATDPGFFNDIKMWSNKTGNTLIDVEKVDKNVVDKIMKGRKNDPGAKLASKSGNSGIDLTDNKTMVVFSGDLDKAIASLIIANGAASMGKKVTMFYTFWGLNILRKPEHVSVKKDFISKMFTAMMPRGTGKLGLSKMNMLGMGPKMIKMVMKKHNVDSLEVLLKTALDNGVKMVACNMSMDLMGITEEELIDGIEYGGVATYLGAAEEANVNLFI